LKLIYEYRDLTVVLTYFQLRVASRYWAHMTYLKWNLSLIQQSYQYFIEEACKGNHAIRDTS